MTKEQLILEYKNNTDEFIKLAIEEASYEFIALTIAETVKYEAAKICLSMNND